MSKLTSVLIGLIVAASFEMPSFATSNPASIITAAPSTNVALAQRKMSKNQRMSKMGKSQRMGKMGKMNKGKMSGMSNKR